MGGHRMRYAAIDLGGRLLLGERLLPLWWRQGERGLYRWAEQQLCPEGSALHAHFGRRGNHRLLVRLAVVLMLDAVGGGAWRLSPLY